ncbi:large ribosomal subunit protein uL23m [Anolis carolinensis]|uniref:Large ribosomal subunit protein uL23m n=1 Tax=Anolis carolinensis TaxID=28377 RepID=G1KJ71_ANOCA|nr:PREDICTED: 39S ribosomal protein L23, mitochondrial [Anolis carolinensis]|eukprot:XP_003214807.1 PREDICTED: 39S ribosomal protein L23, mitochondrial [Anolis carolinensis]
MARRILYPIYQYGNPQLRVFRTDYFLTLVRPGIPQPEDTVQFRIPMEMTRVELKDYLESIYSIPVAAIRTRIQHGSNKRRDHKNRPIKKPDYKVAYVQLAGGQTFQFPDLFPETEETIEPGSFEDIQKKFMEDEKQRQKDDPRQGGISRWFGL